MRLGRSRKVGWVGGWVDEWVGWVGGWVGGWVDGWLTHHHAGGNEEEAAGVREREMGYALGKIKEGGWGGWVGGWVICLSPLLFSSRSTNETEG